MHVHPVNSAVSERFENVDRLFHEETKHLPIPSMYGIFTYIWLIFMVNVGKYIIHGWYGLGRSMSSTFNSANDCTRLKQPLPLEGPRVLRAAWWVSVTSYHSPGKHPFINGLVSVGWIRNIYMKSGCFIKHPSKTGCFGFQVPLTRAPNHQTSTAHWAVSATVAALAAKSYAAWWLQLDFGWVKYWLLDRDPFDGLL